jgi:uncharacterized membrane protein required for colicin V production
VSVADLAIVALIAVFAARGFGRGLVRGVLDLALLAAAGLVASRFQTPVGRLLARGAVDPALAPAVGFFAVFVAVLLFGSVALRFLLGPLFALPWPPQLRLLDRLLGMAAGAAKGAVAVFAVLAVLAAAPPQLRLDRFLRDSTLAPVVEGGVAGAANRLGVRLGQPRVPGQPDVLPIDLDVLR